MGVSADEWREQEFYKTLAVLSGPLGASVESPHTSSVSGSVPQPRVFVVPHPAAT